MTRPITDVAEDLGLSPGEIVPYGKGMAKIPLEAFVSRRVRPGVRYILVTAMTPTPAGEGKTTVAVGLGMALAREGVRSVVCLRQPSLGPVFGIKGGATGGGKATVGPAVDINLHFTGDFHAVTAAHNLLAAVIDNHLHHGNPLEIDARTALWPRALDMEDRPLRQIVTGLGGRADGPLRQGSFVITAASEVMAILALAKDRADLLARLGRIVVGRRRDGTFVTAVDLKVHGAMAALLKDALLPNLVQTAEGSPVLMHAGPFGNIAHGNSSVLADLAAVRLADVVVTEAGFAADLGAEKFFNIKCRVSGLRPHAAVIVATIRALKHHGGGADRKALNRGMANLSRMIQIGKKHGVPGVVAVNVFPGDDPADVSLVCLSARRAGAVDAAPCTAYSEGGPGGAALAKAVLKAARRKSAFRFLYPDKMPAKGKMERIVREIYGGEGIALSPLARRNLADAVRFGYGGLPICMAKTHLSLSYDREARGAPEGFIVPISDVRLSAGAGFLYALAGDIQTMPGLPSVPGTERISFDPATGKVRGLR